MRQMRKFQMVTLAVTVAMAIAGCARLDPGARANNAWSERLTQQAVAQQQEAKRLEQARAAWSQRLTEHARAYQAEEARAKRASDAWSERLTLQADDGMSAAAVQAWTDRLNGLADYYGVAD